MDTPIPDFEFRDADLEDYDGRRCLIVHDVFPGGITVVDGSGHVMQADQIEVMNAGAFVGVAVVLDQWLVDGHLEGVWKIRYNRGMRGNDCLSSQVSDATLDELMLYTLIFG